MKIVSKLSDSFRTSEFYLHHSGFGGWIIVNFFDKRNKTPMMVARHENANEKKFRDISAGRNLLYVEVPSHDNTPERAEEEDDEGPFLCVAFDHHDLANRKRMDIFLNPSADAAHVHVRLAANRDQTLFDEDVPLIDDASLDTLEEPFMLKETKG